MNVHLPLVKTPTEPVDPWLAKLEAVRDELRREFDLWEDNAKDERSLDEVAMDAMNRIIYGTPPAGKQ